MTKQEFKTRWLSGNDGGGITWDEIADCAVEWGLCDTPRIMEMNEVLDMVLYATGIEKAK